MTKLQLFPVLATFCCSLTVACTPHVEETYRLSYRFVSDTTDDWHDSALESGVESYGGEGCVVSFSQNQLDNIRSIVDSENHGIDSWKESYQSIARIVRADGKYFEIEAGTHVRDFDGTTFLISYQTWDKIIEILNKTVRKLPCSIGHL